MTGIRRRTRADLENEITYLRQQAARSDQATRTTLSEAWRELSTMRARMERSAEARFVQQGWEQCLEYLMPRLTDAEHPDDL